MCLDFGADINAIDTEWSATPLASAARAGKKHMIEWLLKKGADPSVPPPTAGESWALPVEWAKRKGDDDIVKMLS